METITFTAVFFAFEQKSFPAMLDPGLGYFIEPFCFHFHRPLFLFLSRRYRTVESSTHTRHRDRMNRFQYLDHNRRRDGLFRRSRLHLFILVMNQSDPALNDTQGKINQGLGLIIAFGRED